MPAFFQEQLDDPMQFDVCASFEGGMVSNQAASTLAPNQSALMVNCDITKANEVTTRRGTARVGSTTVKGDSSPVIRMIRFSTAAGIEQLVASVNHINSATRLYKYTDGAAWTLASPLPMGTGYCPIVQGIDKLYMRGSDTRLYSWDGTTATDLGGGGANQPPLGGPWLGWFTNRLIAADGRDAIAFSDILDAATWPAENSIRIGAGENDQVVGGCAWTGFNLLIVKTRSLWVVNCDPVVEPANFEVRRLHATIGSLSPQTFVQVENGDILGLTTHGVRSMQELGADAQRGRLGPSLSHPIDDWIARINKAYISTATATYWKNRYMLAVPIDAATTPSHTFVYNTLTNSWTGYWTGWNPTAFAERHITADSSTRLVFGDSSGNIYDWMDYVKEADEVTATFQDNGSVIATRLKNRAMNFGDPVSPKTGITLETEYTSVGNLTAQLVADGANAGSAISLSSAQTRKAIDVQSIGQFRELQVDLNATAGKQTIRKIHAGAFIDTLALQS